MLYLILLLPLGCAQLLANLAAPGGGSKEKCTQRMRHMQGKGNNSDLSFSIAPAMDHLNIFYNLANSLLELSTSDYTT